MTSLNLQPRDGMRYVDSAVKNPRVSLLADALRTGDAKLVASRMHLKDKVVYKWTEVSDRRRDPAETFIALIEAMRSIDNPNADQLFLQVAHALGFVAYRVDAPTIDDVEFADAMREFADVISERAKAQSDGFVTAQERLEIATQCNDAIEQLIRYRDSQLARAAQKETR